MKDNFKIGTKNVYLVLGMGRENVILTLIVVLDISAMPGEFVV